MSHDPISGIKARSPYFKKNLTILREYAITWIYEGVSFTGPSFADGTNYYYWKGGVNVFLKFMDHKIWKMVDKRYSAPTITIEGV